mmetsp:Transcript_28078/g.43514  ORF Transcript_28078/g.43514 Transcript_28078/m.43514 type:complete len:84 (+) Transcript_28078:347-598(+)
MMAGTPRGCVPFVGKDGSCPNQHGSWYYGRNGWCDCMDVKTLYFDVTTSLDLSPSYLNTLQYYALSYDVGGKNPSTDGCGGAI